MRLFYIAIIILLYNIAGIKQSFSQKSFYFNNYTSKEGLSSNTIYSIIQDSKGFIWIGTKNGITRFDGKTFKVISAYDRITHYDPYVITVRFLYEDKHKTIWAGTENGLYKYNEEKEIFEHTDGTGHWNISSISEDNEKNLIVCASSKLYVYNNGYIHELKNIRNALYIKRYKNILWILTTSGIEQFELDNYFYKKYEIFDKERITMGSWNDKLLPINDSIILIATADPGAIAFNTKTKQVKHLININKQNNPFPRDFLKLSDEIIWIASENGIYIYNIKNDTYINIKKDFNDPYALPDNAVYCLMQDKEGGIWGGSYFGGVIHLPKTVTNIQLFYPKSKKNTITGNIVREIVKGNNNDLWIGTEDNGLNRFDFNTQTFTNYVPDKQSGISSKNIHGLLLTGNNLLVGTFDQGLDIMDVKTQKVIKHIKYEKGSILKSNFIHSLAKTKNNTIIIGTANGIYSCDKYGNNMTLLPKLPSDIFCSAITVTDDGKIWMGTFGNKGLYYMNDNFKKLYKLQLLDQHKEDILSHSRITDIFEDTGKNLWICTETGLYKYNTRLNTYNRYNTSNNLPSNFIFTVEEDNNNNLYVATSNGLAIINILSNSVRTVSVTHLLNEQFNYKSSYKDAYGNMYFGTIKGMVKLQPESLNTNNFPSPIYITGLQILNKEAKIDASKKTGLKKSIVLTDEIVLNHNQASFSVDFSTLSYDSPGSIKYAYKMEGIDKEWNYVGKNRRVYFTNLKPGDYIFKVFSLVDNNTDTKSGTELKIQILPPWWETTFAYIIYSMLFMSVLAVFFIFHTKVQNAKNNEKITIYKNKKEKELYESQIDFFTKVAHEIRTPLTLIKGPLENITKTKNLPEDVEKYLSIMNDNTKRLLSLTNELLNFRQIETNEYALSFSEINIGEVINITILRFLDEIETRNMSLIKNFPASEVYAYANEEAITKISSNLLHNAVKYGEKLIYIELSVNESEKFIKLRISNDGEKISKDLKEKIFEPFYRRKNEKIAGSGIGLTLARSLATLHNGSLIIVDDKSDLNTFEFKFPYNQTSV